MGISKEFIAAMKTCEDMLVRLQRDYSVPDYHCQASATVTFLKDVSAGAGYTRDRARAEFNGFQAYLSQGYDSGYVSIQHYTFSPGIIGLLSHVLRAGDEIIFEMRDNSNGYLDAAVIPPENLKNPHVHSEYRGIHNDELLITIKRPLKNGEHKTIADRVVIQSQQCPDNTARMIKK